MKTKLIIWFTSYKAKFINYTDDSSVISVSKELEKAFNRHLDSKSKEDRKEIQSSRSCLIIPDFDDSLDVFEYCQNIDDSDYSKYNRTSLSISDCFCINHKYFIVLSNGYKQITDKELIKNLLEEYLKVIRPLTGRFNCSINGKNISAKPQTLKSLKQNE